MSQNKRWLTWDDTYSIVWGNNPFTWDEVFILVGVAESIGGGGAGGPISGKSPWQDVEDKMKKKGLKDEDCEKLFKIVIEVNGMKETITRKIACDDETAVTVDHINKTFESILGPIRVLTENVKMR